MKLPLIFKCSFMTLCKFITVFSAMWWGIVLADTTDGFRDTQDSMYIGFMFITSFGYGMCCLFHKIDDDFFVMLLFIWIVFLIVEIRSNAFLVADANTPIINHIVLLLGVISSTYIFLRMHAKR